MNRSGIFIVSACLLLIGLSITYWFYNNFSWVTEKQEVGFQGIAKTNNLLAAEFYLRKMGIIVHQVSGLVVLRNLPATTQTLLIATQRETINNDLSQQLLHWVKSGGHVIIEAKHLSKKELKEAKKKKALVFDDLLEQWPVFSKINHNDNNNGATRVSLDLGNNASHSLYKPIIAVEFPYDRVLSHFEKTGITSGIASGIGRELETKAHWLIKDDFGHYLLQFSLGKGLLTVLTSTAMFTNRQIADYDHAQFLHYLVQQSGHDDAVWLVRVDDMPPLWQWLWNNAPYMLFTLGLLFLIFLWRAPLRFGPVLHDALIRRRSLLEHIRASGYYRWHNKQSVFLLQQVQYRVWSKIQKIHPAIQRDDSMKMYDSIESVTGIKAMLIKEALSPVSDRMKKNINKDDFLYKIKILKRIQKQL